MTNHEIVANAMRLHSEVTLPTPYQELRAALVDIYTRGENLQNRVLELDKKLKTRPEPKESPRTRGEREDMAVTHAALVREVDKALAILPSIQDEWRAELRATLERMRTLLCEHEVRAPLEPEYTTLTGKIVERIDALNKMQPPQIEVNLLPH